MRLKRCMCITSLMTLFLFVKNANASTMGIPNTTGLRENPSMQLSRIQQTPTYNLQTSNDTVTGANSFVYFYNRMDLPTSFAFSSTRTMEVNLYEDDKAPNADEHVKQYIYKFNGRLMDGVTVKTINSGNIEGKGDYIGEFYLTFFLHSVPEDQDYNAWTGTFFNYEIKVK